MRVQPHVYDPELDIIDNRAVIIVLDEPYSKNRSDQLSIKPLNGQFVTLPFSIFVLLENIEYLAWLVQLTAIIADHLPL